MRLIDVATISTNPTVGAFRSNTDQLCHWAQKASVQRKHVAAFGEGAIGGYPPEDLLDWDGFTALQWKQLKRFARFTATLPFRTFFVVPLFLRYRGANFNAVAAVCSGDIVGGHFKENLPTYNVFREGRKCKPGAEGYVVNIGEIQAPFGDVMFDTPFGIVSFSACEDVWNGNGPLMRRAFSGSELDMVINASPFRIGVAQTRYEMQATRSSDNMIALASSYIVGANDGLVFDAGGFFFVNGRLIRKAPRFVEGMTSCVIDLDVVATARAANTTWRLAQADYLRTHQPTKVVKYIDAMSPDENLRPDVPAGKNFFMPANHLVAFNPQEELFEELEQAIVLGTADYYRKVGVFNFMGNPGSGGKDSAVTSILMWRAAIKLLKEKGCNDDEIKDWLRTKYWIFSMPTKFNSDTTKTLIAELAEELGVAFKEIPIQEAYERELAALQSMLPEGKEIPRITKQNVQVRIRFSRMWNWANAVGGFFPQNSNMSEKAVGYCTVGGGDIEGILSMIANVPKSLIGLFLFHLGKKYGLASALAIAGTKASAELEEGQEDEKDLMPFPVLDAHMALFAGEKLMPLDVYRRVRQMFSDDELLGMYPGYQPGMLKQWTKKFTTLFMRSIFKWVRSPLSLHLGSTDLERERAMELPVVQSMEWLEDSLQAIDLEP